MGKKNWEVVLKEMYENEMYKVNSDNEHLNKNTHLSKKEINNAINYAQRAGLLEFRGGGYLLTSKGFEVFDERKQREERIEHDREMNEQRDQTNRAIAFLTIGLVLVTSVDTVVRAMVGRQWGRWATVFAMISVIVAAVLVREIYQADMIFQESTSPRPEEDRKR
jgi:cation transport ATPase